MYILANTLFNTLIRTFFYSIDRIVYNFIPAIYDLLISISRTSVLTQGDIAVMADRIYKLLAVFMIFKVTFSLIMYVVNPDDFSDKSKGVGKLITNTVISLCLLILTPYFFRYAYQLQAIVLNDNSMATLIFGKEINKNFLNTAGNDMAFITLSPFFTPDVSLPELYECSELMEKSSDGKTRFNESCSGISNNDYEDLSDDSSMMALVEDGKKFKKSDLETYVAGVNAGSVPLMFRQDIVTATTTASANNGDKNILGIKSQMYVIDYKFGFSTIVGCVIVLLLITFCMDVALRSIKLAFLQLAAPIPIISLVDPKSGKDGLFKKWYQMCFKTFLSLFVRLLGLYFAVYIISNVAEMKMVDIIDGSYVSNGLIAIFVIIGALMFAKQLPKILEGLGIKLDGDGKFFLNPLKKFEEQALGGKKILGMGAAGAAAVAAGTSNFGTTLFDKNTWKNKDGKFSPFGGIGKTIGSTVGGTSGALWRGARKAMKGEKAGKVFANSYGEAMFAKVQREDLSRKGSTLPGRMRADFNRYVGRLNAGQRQELDLASLDAEKKNRVDRVKLQREQMEYKKQQLLDEKTEKQKIHSNNQKQLSAITGRINSLKGVEDVNGKINVKDRDELVNNLKANDRFYVKENEMFTDSNGNRRKATKDDVVNMVLSDEGKAADEALNKEKERALKYLKENDEEVKNRINILESNGLNASEMTAKEVKTEMISEQNAVNAVESEYYNREQEFKEQEDKFKLEEKAIEDWYKGQIQERNLDKDSAEWVANAADNAARSVKNPQPEGFKPTASVDETAYTPFTTGVMMGGNNVPPGRPPIPPRGPKS